jgi:hypothetical protein
MGGLIANHLTYKIGGLDIQGVISYAPAFGSIPAWSEE